jgi:hypothetical protein
MPHSASLLAPGSASPASAAPHLVALAGEWALWRDIAVRTAGFPVSGLDAFGSPDEQAGLRAVASDPLFRTAVTWQNRAAMHNAVAKVAAGAAAPASRRRQREEVVASYWQRYCAKNDTIGFFGPLAWGHAADAGPAVQANCGQLVSESAVHFEAWAIQALATCSGGGPSCSPTPTRRPSGPGRRRPSPTTRQAGPPASTSRRTFRSPRPASPPSTRVTTCASSATSIPAPTRWRRGCSPPATRTGTDSSAPSPPT